VLCAGVEGENLALTAVREFRALTGWDGPPVAIEIVKRIPVAAGMAGGSSDAAAALKLISQVSGIPIPKELPMRLGADVTVMLRGERALMTGAGEHVEPLPGEKPPLIVIPLAAGLSAAQVYREFDAHDRPRTPDELEAAAQALRGGTFEPVNDLEPAARRLCPLIEPALAALREAGARHPMVSGSGPTVFGIGGDLERIRARYPRAVAA
jgi:4-diphosphocytidyl-2-C-methyl-D-erythritol kinase